MIPISHQYYDVITIVEVCAVLAVSSHVSRLFISLFTDTPSTLRHELVDEFSLSEGFNPNWVVSDDSLLCITPWKHLEPQ